MSRAITGHLEHFDPFAACLHIRVPMGDALGNAMLAASMGYYRMPERLRGPREPGSGSGGSLHGSITGITVLAPRRSASSNGGDQAG